MNNCINATFCNRIKALRVEQGMSQEDLAAKLNISRSCLANYEIGKRQPDNEMLIRIPDVCHVLVDYLIDRPEYRSLDLSFQELNECTRIKKRLQEQDSVLDLSVLDMDGKIAVIQYYDYIETMNRVRQLETPLPQSNQDRL